MTAKRTKQRTTPPTMTEILRERVSACGISFYRLELDTRVSRQSLMKFARGEQTLRLDQADKLARYFSLELKPSDPPPSP